jgi:dihydroxy-acid dehydratase
VIVMDLLRRGVRPRDLLTRDAFENAIAAAAGTGGSTNSVLHLLALAREAGVPLEIDDFDTISRRTPIIADLRPGGKYVALDVDRAGGIQLIAKRMVEAGNSSTRATHDRDRTHARKKRRRRSRRRGRP